MSGKHSGQDHPHPKYSENRFDVLMWHCYQTHHAGCQRWMFTVCGCAPSCWKNVMFTSPAPWMTSFCSCSMLYAILHSACCLLSCKLLTFLHPVVPSFTLPTSHSIVSYVSNCCMHSQIPCTYWIIPLIKGKPDICLG